jgi:hypothetical protein
MEKRKNWLYVLAIVCLSIAAAGIVWAQYGQESWTIYSYTTNNTHIITPKYTQAYHWSCVHHDGFYSFAIRPYLGGTIVFVADRNTDTSGTVNFTAGSTYVIGTDEGTLNPPGYATCNVNNYDQQQQSPGGP